jgi:flap endonuclease-1
MNVSKEYTIQFRSFDTEAVVQLLCDKHDFSKERVQGTLEKLEQLNTTKKQKGLGDFF